MTDIVTFRARNTLDLRQKSTYLKRGSFPSRCYSINTYCRYIKTAVLHIRYPFFLPFARPANFSCPRFYSFLCKALRILWQRAGAAACHWFCCLIGCFDQQATARRGCCRIVKCNGQHRRANLTSTIKSSKMTAAWGWNKERYVDLVSPE